MAHRGTVRNSDTPLCLGFSDGEECLVGKLAWDHVVVNANSQIRFLTAEQVRVHVELGEEVPEQFLVAAMNDARLACLDSPRGNPVAPNRPPPYDLPAGIPEAFLGFQVHASTVAPACKTGYWEADWWWAWNEAEERHEGHIWWYEPWLRILLQREAWPLIRDTHEHEFHEASESLAMARLMYPEATGAQLCGLAVQFGGYAHGITIAVVDGYAGPGAEQRYNRDDSRTMAEFGAMDPSGE